MKRKVNYAFVIGVLFFVLSMVLLGCSNSKSQNPNAGDQLGEEMLSDAIIDTEGTFQSYTLEELNEKAILIIEGVPTEVVDSYEQDGAAFTKYAFKVTKLHKGDIEENGEINLLQDGNEEQAFDNHPLMELNKTYLLFLEKSPTGNLIMVGGPSGKYEYKEDEGVFENIGHEKLNWNLERVE